MQRTVVIVLAVALLAAGIASAIAGCVPYEQMQSVGSLVRRASDFTPERFARFRHVCWFFAVALPGLASLVWSAKPQALVSAESVGRERLTDDEARRDWLLWLIVAVGLALRLHRLFDPVAYDEAYTYLNFASRPWYEAIGDYNSTNNHLLNTLLMHFSTRIFGPQEWAMRWHVLLAGTALPYAVFAWGRNWLGRTPALLAAAAVALSPMLITYSTDARGYMLVVLAAIVFDWSLGRLAGLSDVDRTEFLSRAAAPLPGPPPAGRGEREGNERRAWWTACGALVFGLCSMPLMVYPALGSAAWFVATPILDRRQRGAVKSRVLTLVSLGLLAAPAVAAFYSPAYIFRGMMFLRDPVVQAADAGGFATSLGTAWQHAFAWWTDGIIPGWVWGVLAFVGFVGMPVWSGRWRWLLPFGVVLALNIGQHVAPPPRIYMHLAPWLFLAAGQGVAAITGFNQRLSQRSGCVLVGVVLISGSIYALKHEVLFHADERASFVSVPDAIRVLLEDRARHPGESAVLLAPLPCDLPSIFYLRRAGIEVPVNARPEPGTRVYLLARIGETPDDVLATPLLDMSQLAAGFSKWTEVAAFDRLTLYSATFDDAPTNAHY